MKHFLSILLLLSASLTGFSQSVTSTIKGRVVDLHAGSGIPGATVLLIDSVAPTGTFSDEDGYFRLENVNVGRQAIQVRMQGYEPVMLSNLMVLSGKELDVEVQMEEKITVLEDVVITGEEDKKQPINEMATVSTRTISIEEAGRFSGSFQDPARMAQNFAGVSGASDDRNDIIIRGNSPTGVLWRMEGIDIPSPNHFATLGTTGGPVSMLNINNLKDSDFMTSAFTADYGNALSGVFDLKLRKGNSDKREYLAQVGFNGFEVGLEGPFSKNSKASYLANYRYSMLAVASALGLQFGTGGSVPYYQDLTFKVHVPTKNAGTFNVFGIGGLSNIEFLAEDAGDNNLYSDANQNAKFRSNTGVTGISHTYFLDSKTYSRLVLAVSGTQSAGKIDSINPITGEDFHVIGQNNQQVKYSLNYKLNRKFNAKNTANFGVVADYYDLAVLDSAYSPTGFRTVRDFSGNAQLLQTYVQWLHRFDEKLSSTVGLHSQHFFLSGSNVIEPRAGLKYKLTEKQTLNLGAGLHSQLQPLTVYFVEDPMAETNAERLPNQSLDFTRAFHAVAGYDVFLTQNLRIKAETYYQRLFGVPVHSYASSFSMLNAGRDFILPEEIDLVNEGTGTNYGFELTVERFFNKGYYFLFTSSLFNSTYEGSDGIERNTAFNGNYVFNALGGKEFKLGTRATLGFDTKITYAGGNRFTPINLTASQMAGMEIRDESQAFEDQYPDYFRADFKITVRMNHKKFAQQFSVDIQNITNHQNVFQYGYNASTGEAGTVYQRGFFPDVQYKVFF